ncbi:MAG: peptidoglycan bridge formation glycyltransferase FemA/FemB family protein [Anaerolineae bacterium]|nr:peptidoglycan bridge formation glycyltransferase FemA/FemB family protein [Anaerolineae bacterium]
MTVRVAFTPTPQEEATWDAFVAGHPHGHILQTSRWAALKAQFGWRPCLVTLTRGRDLAGGALLLFRRLPMGQSVAYAPKGPVVDWAQADLAGELLAALDDVARREGAWYLKVEPEVPEGDAPAPQALQGAGYRAAPRPVQPRSTIWVDLTASPDEMLARMKPKTRYNVRLAGRKEVEVRAAAPEDLPAFYRLMQATAARDGFPIHAAAYYEAAYRLFVPAGWGRLFLAHGPEGLLAGLMAFAFGGKAWYMYGASSDAGRHRMPNYLLQWEAMQWARAQGCHTYDLWGIPDEVGQNPEAFARTVTDRSGGLWGVYRFKQGFGGQVVRYVGAYDRVFFRPGHWLAEVGWPWFQRLRARGHGEGQAHA